MLNFYYGTELESLADKLMEDLSVSSSKNPLDPEIFVVQNHGIGQWLSLYMAEQEGVAANLEFEFPSERVWKLIRSIYPRIPETLPSDRGPMTWSLMELFEDEQQIRQFDNLRHYISDEDLAQRKMRSWKLASKIADVFDQYLIYRPRMILDWEQGKLHTKNIREEEWQMKLWNTLTNHWKKNYEGEVLHRARLQEDLLNHIEGGTLDTGQLPNRITVFGVSTASPSFIETIVKLSRYTEIHFYHFSVDPAKTESQHFDNPLLQSLGEEGSSFMKIFSSSVKAEKNIAGNMEWAQVDRSGSTRNSVLASIQQDLWRDSSLGGRKLNVPAADSSIQVHSCHSPMREVEVLYDQLLAILEENSKLNADDILIMTPDIETYAPMIEAVFGTPDEGQPSIPFSIEDRGVEGEFPTIQAFLKILDLCESRFKITDVMDVLDSEPVQEAFGYNEDELNKLEKWIRDNRIRWGIDGDYKSGLGLPDSDHFTLQSGLRRILLGYMMRSDGDNLYNGIFAYDEVETSDDAELAGKFSNLLHELFDFNRQVNEPKSPGRWQVLLNELIDRFLPDNRDGFWEISQIRQALDRLVEQAGLAGYHQNVSFSILRRWLQEQLEKQSTGGGRIGRGVTFSSLMPMRSIPFGVIGMIGMNEGSFPRSKIPIEFDMTYLDTQPGDPVQSKEDRYLFLENLLSTRSHLYFSYIGQSNRQDTEFPPSVVLKEFLDYLKEHYGLQSEDIVSSHRLQPFSPRYFKDKGLFSYSKTQMQISLRLSEGESLIPSFFEAPLAEADKEMKQLSIQDLLSFFQHPAKFLLRNRLGIYLQDEEVLAEDREPFELDKLSEYQVGQELLQRYLKEKPLESYQEVMRSRDMLPEGWRGEQDFSQKAQEVRAFGEEIQQRLNQEKLPDREVNLDINSYRITGTLSGIYSGSLMEYRFGKARAKDKVEWWIRHLLFQAVKPEGHPGESVLFSWNDGSFNEFRLSPVEEAGERLKDLLGWYWQGLQKPLPLYCKSSHAYAEKVIKEEKSREEGLEKAINKWEPGWNGYPGEGDDAYHKLITGGKKPFHSSDFTELSRKFWLPYFEALKKEEG